jgi:uncharacterized protein (DUF2141 family)
MVWTKFAGMGLIALALVGSLLAASMSEAQPSDDTDAQVDNDPAAKNTLTLEITGIREAAGTMACALFWENKGFPKKHRRALRRTWVDVEDTTVRCVFKRAGLGEFAASVFLDINENGKLDTNAIGTPSEPWGVSQVRRSKRSGPSLYKDAKFVYEGGAVTIPITLVYD